MIIDAGELRQVITLQRRGISRDAAGGFIDEWVDEIASIRCKISTGGCREFYAAQKKSAEITHVIVCRYRAVFTEALSNEVMRVLFKESALRITSVIDEDHLHQWVILGCKQVN